MREHFECRTRETLVERRGGRAGNPARSCFLRHSGNRPAHHQNADLSRVIPEFAFATIRDRRNRALAVPSTSAPTQVPACRFASTGDPRFRNTPIPLIARLL